MGSFDAVFCVGCPYMIRLGAGKGALSGADGDVVLSCFWFVPFVF